MTHQSQALEWHEESHALVYNSNYRATEKKNCIGAVIDNRSNAPVRLIDEEDRSDISKSQQLFDNFFNANTKIQHVYLIEKKQNVLCIFLIVD